MNSMEAFEALNQSPLSPPGWLFPVVWTVLYVLMGIARIWYPYRMRHMRKRRVRFGPMAFSWHSIFCGRSRFFNLKWYLFAFLWLVILWILILITALRFGRIRKPAGYLLVPYLLWVAFGRIPEPGNLSAQSVAEERRKGRNLIRGMPSRREHAPVLSKDKNGVYCAGVR